MGGKAEKCCCCPVCNRHVDICCPCVCDRLCVTADVVDCNGDTRHMFSIVVPTWVSETRSWSGFLRTNSDGRDRYVIAIALLLRRSSYTDRCEVCLECEELGLIGDTVLCQELDGHYLKCSNLRVGGITFEDVDFEPLFGCETLGSIRFVCQPDQIPDPVDPYNGTCFCNISEDDDTVFTSCCSCCAPRLPKTLYGRVSGGGNCAYSDFDEAFNLYWSGEDGWAGTAGTCLGLSVMFQCCKDFPDSTPCEDIIGMEDDNGCTGFIAIVETATNCGRGRKLFAFGTNPCSCEGEWTVTCIGACAELCHACCPEPPFFANVTWTLTISRNPL